MANDLRSRLKATPIKKLKARIDEDNSMLNNGNAEFLSLEDGKLMKIRVFPAHPDHDNFYVPRKCYWLPFTTDSGDERRGTVLDSIFHGKTAMDIVQEYVSYVKTHGSETAVAAVTAQRDGLLPSLSWLCYAAEVKDDEMEPKLWEFKKSVRDAMNRLAITEEEDEPIETDPFTDPDEGLPLFVKYIKNPNKKKGENYYDVSLGKKPKVCPLTDEAIEKFMKLKPVEEVAGTYTLEMFERALEGLQNFDEQHGIDIFGDDEWLEIVEKVRAQYSEADDEPKKKVTKKASKRRDDDDEDDVPPVRTKKNRPGVRIPEPEEEPEEEAPAPEPEDEPEPEAGNDDGLDDMDRAELKAFIRDNDLGDTVKVYKSTTDDQIREAIRAALGLNGGEEEEEAPAPEPEEEDDAPAPAASGAARSLAAIRAKLGKK